MKTWKEIAEAADMLAQDIKKRFNAATDDLERLNIFTILRDAEDLAGSIKEEAQDEKASR